MNAVIEAERDVSARQILADLHEVERESGRVRRERWGARTLDLDLLAIGDTILPDEATFGYWHDLPLSDQRRHYPDDLILPHPRLHQRSFVLVPLCDVAPDWRHPVLGRTAQELCDDLDADDRASVVPI